eukprot:COSAG02_NODE_62531_length_265_cov_1.246988_1_plen_38_part_10
MLAEPVTPKPRASTHASILILRTSVSLGAATTHRGVKV